MDKIKKMYFDFETKIKEHPMKYFMDVEKKDTPIKCVYYTEWGCLRQSGCKCKLKENDDE